MDTGFISWNLGKNMFIALEKALQGDTRILIELADNKELSFKNFKFNMPKNLKERQLITASPLNGIVLDKKLQLKIFPAQTQINDAIFVSDLLNISEFTALDLLLSAQYQQKYYPEDLPQIFLAIMLYLDSELYMFKSLEIILKCLYEPTNSEIVMSAKKVFEEKICPIFFDQNYLQDILVFYSSHQSVIKNSLFDVLYQKDNNILISYKIKLMKMIDDINSKAINLICIKIFNGCGIYEDIKLLIKFLKENMHYSNINNPVPLNELTKESFLQKFEINANLSDISFTCIMCLFGMMSPILYIKNSIASKEKNIWWKTLQYHSEIIQLLNIENSEGPDWTNGVEIKYMLLMMYSTFVRVLRHCIVDTNETESFLPPFDEEDGLDTAIMFHTFTTIKSLLIANTNFYRQKQYTILIDNLIENIILHFPWKVRELKNDSDDSARLLSNVETENLYPFGDLPQYFEELLLLLAKLYAKDPYNLNLASKYWGNDPDPNCYSDSETDAVSSPLRMIDSKTKPSKNLNLSKFIHILCDGQATTYPTQYFPYLQLLVSISSNSNFNCASEVFTMLKASAQHSSIVSWEHFIGALAKYATIMGNDIGNLQAMPYDNSEIDWQINDLELYGMSLALHLLRNVLMNVSEAKQYFLEWKFSNRLVQQQQGVANLTPLPLFVTLLSKAINLPLSLKAEVLDVVTAFIDFSAFTTNLNVDTIMYRAGLNPSNPPHLSMIVWNILFQYQTRDGSDIAFNKLSSDHTLTSDTLNDFKTYIELFESSKLETYHITKAFLRLIYHFTLNVLPDVATITQNAIGPPGTNSSTLHLYHIVIYISENIFTPLFSRSYKNMNDKWELATLCLQIYGNILKTCAKASKYIDTPDAFPYILYIINLAKYIINKLLEQGLFSQLVSHILKQGLNQEVFAYIPNARSNSIACDIKLAVRAGLNLIYTLSNYDVNGLSAVITHESKFVELMGSQSVNIPIEALKRSLKDIRSLIVYPACPTLLAYIIQIFLPFTSDENMIANKEQLNCVEDDIDLQLAQYSFMILKKLNNSPADAQRLWQSINMILQQRSMHNSTQQFRHILITGFVQYIDAYYTFSASPITCDEPPNVKLSMFQFGPSASSIFLNFEAFAYHTLSSKTNCNIGILTPVTLLSMLVSDRDASLSIGINNGTFSVDHQVTPFSKFLLGIDGGSPAITDSTSPCRTVLDSLLELVDTNPWFLSQTPAFSMLLQQPVSLFTEEYFANNQYEAAFTIIHRESLNALFAVNTYRLFDRLTKNFANFASSGSLLMKNTFSSADFPHHNRFVAILRNRSLDDILNDPAESNKVLKSPKNEGTDWINHFTHHLHRIDSVTEYLAIINNYTAVNLSEINDSLIVNQIANFHDTIIGSIYARVAYFLRYFSAELQNCLSESLPSYLFKYLTALFQDGRDCVLVKLVNLLHVENDFPDKLLRDELFEQIDSAQFYQIIEIYNVPNGLGGDSYYDSKQIRYYFDNHTNISRQTSTNINLLDMIEQFVQRLNAYTFLVGAKRAYSEALVDLLTLVIAILQLPTLKNTLSNQPISQPAQISRKRGSLMEYKDYISTIYHIAGIYVEKGLQHDFLPTLSPSISEAFFLSASIISDYFASLLFDNVGTKQLLHGKIESKDTAASFPDIAPTMEGLMRGSVSLINNSNYSSTQCRINLYGIIMDAFNLAIQCHSVPSNILMPSSADNDNSTLQRRKNVKQFIDDTIKFKNELVSSPFFDILAKDICSQREDLPQILGTNILTNLLLLDTFDIAFTTTISASSYNPTIPNQPPWIEKFSRQGYLQKLLFAGSDSNLYSDNDNSNSFDSRLIKTVWDLKPAEIKPLFAFQTQMLFFETLASTRYGANIIIDSGILFQLRDMKVFDVRYELIIGANNLEALPKAYNLPNACQRYDEFILLPTLKMIKTLFCTSSFIRNDMKTCFQIIDFWQAHANSLTLYIKPGNIIPPTMPFDISPKLVFNVYIVELLSNILARICTVLNEVTPEEITIALKALTQVTKMREFSVDTFIQKAQILIETLLQYSYNNIKALYESSQFLKLPFDNFTKDSKQPHLSSQEEEIIGTIAEKLQNNAFYILNYYAFSYRARPMSMTIPHTFSQSKSTLVELYIKFLHLECDMYAKIIEYQRYLLQFTNLQIHASGQWLPKIRNIITRNIECLLYKICLSLKALSAAFKSEQTLHSRDKLIITLRRLLIKDSIIFKLKGMQEAINMEKGESLSKTYLNKKSFLDSLIYELQTLITILNKL